MRQATYSDPMIGESSEWMRDSEPRRERLAEESDVAISLVGVAHASRPGG